MSVNVFISGKKVLANFPSVEQLKVLAKIPGKKALIKYYQQAINTIFMPALARILPYGMSNKTFLSDKDKSELADDLNTILRNKRSLRCDLDTLLKKLVLHQLSLWNKEVAFAFINTNSSAFGEPSEIKQYIREIPEERYTKLMEGLRLHVAIIAAEHAMTYARTNMYEFLMCTVGDEVDYHQFTPLQHQQWLTFLAMGAIRYGTADCVASMLIGDFLLKSVFGENISLRSAGPKYYRHYLLIIEDELIWDPWDNKCYLTSERHSHLLALQPELDIYSDPTHGAVILGEKAIYKGSGTAPVYEIQLARELNGPCNLSKGICEKITEIVIRCICEADKKTIMESVCQSFCTANLQFVSLNRELRMSISSAVDEVQKNYPEFKLHQ